MKKQNFEIKNEIIDKAFDELKVKRPDAFKERLNFSWSNWGFGQEPLEESVKRLKKYGVDYIELHGNHYGPDLGYNIGETKKILSDNGMKVSGVCGMFSADNDMASNRNIQRQAALDYIRREVDFTAEMGGHYLLVVPAAVGRPEAYDDAEIIRSVEALRIVADRFEKTGVKAAIEPIRAAEVSIIHTFAEAKEYIKTVNRPGVGHINGDLYHMLTGEDHIPQTIVDAGDMLTNLHAADTNRCALGAGFLDLDRIIKALYLIGYNREGCFFTPEPLGPGGDPYPAMHGIPDGKRMDLLVEDTVRYFREREALLSA
ncbi:sugar phosphate isomerase/epimerase family protein [Marispirochaeta aestuarii]|uniref:sugar phosphate isomerase/epimerase family protein n=1 Tax=Marispirochaeta aestuarii TaxID=1963862 RepID=UPI0029C74757|nr:sugar phosphate isomerase/epimerase family protein [Marispirochaeta aestuarii]